MLFISKLIEQTGERREGVNRDPEGSSSVALSSPVEIPTNVRWEA